MLAQKSTFFVDLMQQSEVCRYIRDGFCVTITPQNGGVHRKIRLPGYLLPERAAALMQHAP